MATPPLTTLCLPLTRSGPLPIFTIQTPLFKTKRRFQVICNKKLKHHSFSRTNSAFTDGVSNNENKESNFIFLDFFQNLVGYIRPIFPGGSWWNLSDAKEAENATEKPITVWIALSRMWDLIGRHKWIVYLALASLIVAAVSEITMPRILAEAIFSAQKRESMVFHKSARFLVLLCVTSGIFSGLRSGCFSIANIVMVNRLRETLYSAHVFQDISFFDTQAVGSLTSRLGADCQRLSTVIGNDINLILRNSLQGAGALANLLTLSWPLTLSALLICSLLSTVVSVYGQYQKKAAMLTQECNAHANNVAQATLTMMRTVRVSGTEQNELGRRDVNHDWSCITRAAYQSIGATEKVFQLMDLLPSNQFLSEGVKLQRLMGHVQFVNVSFHYPSRFTVPVLDHVCLSIEANEVVAIVGLSGSGKSTFVNLLLRLYEPSNGQIYIDGFPLKDLDIRWLRGKIGFVGQEPQLFCMDVKSNIMYGCPNDIKQEDVELSAKQVYAHEFILSLPRGYETLVDDDLLSGGQKQQIAIARAILRDPAILVLDEATSALDSESEHYVKEILHAFRNDSKKKRTVIAIAHRLSTIKAADRIVVIDGGRIIEVGDHTELVQKGGLYAQLVKRQTESVS